MVQRELTECNVTSLFSHIQTLQVPDLERGFSVRVQDLRSGLTRRSSSSVDEFLQEDSSQDSIGFFFKDGREDTGYSIARRDEVDRFFRTGEQ